MKQMTLFIGGLLIAVNSISVATDRLYPNQESKSPNGRFVATATSPDNQESYAPFARDFTIVLRDGNKVVWSYKQKKDKASPVELIPTDNGHLIVRNAWDRYCVAAKAGTLKMVIAPLSSLPKDERDKFTDETTAGTMWLQYSKQGFFADSGTTYFYLRTYWGRIFIIDFVRATPVQDPSLAQKIEDHLVAETKAWINRFDGQFFGKCKDCGGEHLKDEITANVFIIKKHALREGQQLIQKTLERANDGRNSSLPRFLNKL